MPLWLLFVIVCLATYRATRLITTDQLPIIALPRESFVQRWGVPQNAQNPKLSFSGKRTNLLMRSLAYLWECEWCTGMWIGALVVYGTWRWTPLGDQPIWVSVLLWLTASGVTGLIAQREPH